MDHEHRSRRDVLKTATALVAGSSIAGVAGRPAKASQSDPALSPSLGQVDQALRQAVDARTVPGVVAIGATDKGVIYEGAFGPSMTADSIFWIASMTKAITATAVHAVGRAGQATARSADGQIASATGVAQSLGGV